MSSDPREAKVVPPPEPLQERGTDVLAGGSYPGAPTSNDASVGARRHRWYLSLGRLRGGLALYIVRRLAFVVPILLILSICVFALTSLVPGGPTAAYLAGHTTNESTVRAIQAKYHLDESLPNQYWTWLWGVLHLDLGTSIFTGQSIVTEISNRIGLTLILNVASAIASIIIGGALGIVAAFRQGKLADRVAVGLTIFVSNAPAFAVAIAFVYVFAGLLHWFPQFGIGSAPLEYAYHLVLPVAVMTLGGLGFITKLTRAAILDVLAQDYVLFARCRGLKERKVIATYILRNALIPLLTMVGLIVLGFMSGTIFVETVFALPGLGLLFTTAATNTDVPVIQALVLLSAAWIVVANVLVDVCYALVDPRVTISRGAR